MMKAGALMSRTAASQYVVRYMDATPAATKAPKGNTSGREGWIGHRGSPKMSWRMIAKLLLAMALDDWDWRRKQKGNERKRWADQRRELRHTPSRVS